MSALFAVFRRFGAVCRPFAAAGATTPASRGGGAGNRPVSLFSLSGRADDERRLGPRDPPVADALRGQGGQLVGAGGRGGADALEGVGGRDGLVGPALGLRDAQDGPGARHGVERQAVLQGQVKGGLGPPVGEQGQVEERLPALGRDGSHIPIVSYKSLIANRPGRPMPPTRRPGRQWAPEIADCQLPIAHCISVSRPSCGPPRRRQSAARRR